MNAPRDIGGAFAFTCFLFPVIGIPVAIREGKNSWSSGQVRSEYPIQERKCPSISACSAG